jgi:hypothetical protein
MSLILSWPILTLAVSLVGTFGEWLVRAVF